jgi:hypothetical protein
LGAATGAHWELAQPQRSMGSRELDCAELGSKPRPLPPLPAPLNPQMVSSTTPARLQGPALLQLPPAPHLLAACHPPPHQAPSRLHASRAPPLPWRTPHPPTHPPTCTTEGSRRSPPTASGSSMMVLGASLSSSSTTSCSCRCLRVWNGLATNESKLGSPAGHSAARHGPSPFSSVSPS